MAVADRPIQQESLSYKLNHAFGKMQFLGKKRLDFYKKLTALLKNNVPIVSALETIQHIASINGSRPFTPQALAAQQIRQRIYAGQSLSESMEGWIPSRDMMILQAADFGTPIKPLENVIELNLAMKRIQSSFLGELSYPAVVIVIALIIMIGISTNIVPAFTNIASDVEWTGISNIFVHVTGNIAKWWPAYLTGLAALIIAITVSMPSWSGPTRTIFDNIPPWSVYRLWMGSSWLLSLAAMLSAGITEIEALRRLERMPGKWIRTRNGAIRVRVANGMDLGSALMHSPYNFPDLEINLTIAVYAGLSSSDEAIKQVARDWIEDSEDRLKTQAAVLRAVALFFAASVIATTVLSIFDMEGQITASLGL